MKFSITIISFILLISFKTIAQNKNENDLTAKIDSILESNNFNGVVYITENSKQIFSKAMGYSDLDKKNILKFKDQFVIGSISKQITAVLVLREFEKGKIKLDDKINQYLTQINQPWSKEVTIHQLLTHTHGIVTLDEPLEFVQGSQFHYSQLGYELLAQILEKVTNKNFEQLSMDFFKQNGLKNTFHPNNKKYKNLVKGYEENEDKLLEYASNSLDNYVPAGAFISNAADLNKWSQSLYSGKLVKTKTLKLMETKYATRIHPIFDKVDYGYGLLFQDGEQNIQIGALGYAPGFASACYFYPQTRSSVIVLANTAKNLDNFKMTFKVHTEIMDLMKKRKKLVEKI
ncbi:CubicO group peptidase (beta-lactamase class C family) [Flavobacterium tiangeerense]|uniref:CubicO group peptidase (Beta-lactamase class C family) n=1 Tax=Flavobacterium tiangeerense TaxID=459471 RepID=A0ABY3FLG1_9FLAO|nr:serine hydrolase domain-containing protein [Flavobacterium tiangeerense]TWI01264.1 CubicO group peptidase (beta-lactamase class C family) [Flavobacterium tiangeerense]